MIIVVNPLVAIMQEQVRILTQKGMKAEVPVHLFQEIKDRMFQVLFFSPECLLTD